MRLFLPASGLAAVAVFLAACSGGGGGSNPGGPTPSPTLSPVILIPGLVAQYSGTDVTTHVYANPTGTQSNYTAGYSFSTVRDTENAASGAPAAYDQNAVTAYTITQDPGQGIARQSQTTDTFLNQFAVTGGTSVQNVGSQTTTVGTDETANAAGGGPYTQTVNSNATFTTPQTTGVYPLVTGTVINEPIGQTISRSTTDANGSVEQVAYPFATSVSETINSDGSYTLSQTISNGQSSTTTENSNGSATFNSQGPVYTENDTIGAPANGGSGYTIPVTTYRQYATTGATPAPTATTLAYNATDWYPGNALPLTPFETDTVTVKGPVTALPSGCSGAIAEPNLIEVDTNEATLNVDASYATTTQQRFASSVVDPVCVLRTVTTMSYALTTGQLSQTSTESYAQVLTSVGTGGATSARKRK